MNKPMVPFIQARTIIESLLLCLLAATIGLGLNYKTVYRAFTGQVVLGVEKGGSGQGEQAANRIVAVASEPFPVSLEEVDQLLAEGALLVDARNSEDFNAGHLADAVSLPAGKIEQLLPSFAATVDHDRVLIIYCSGYGCPDSYSVGIRLAQAGFSDVLLYEGGFPEWRDAGRLVEEGEQ